MNKTNIIIVDQNDDIIGDKPRNEISSHDIYRVSALWLANELNEILIAQRSFQKSKDPGKWGPAVAGTVEKGESYSDNIRKEILEELGIEIKDLRIGPKRKDLGKNYFAQWFLATIPKNTKLEIQKDEVEKVRWISKIELKLEIESSPNEFLQSVQNFEELFETK